MKKNLIGIGLIGQYCSGKDSAAQSIKRYIGNQENGAGYVTAVFNTTDKYNALSQVIYNHEADMRERKEWRDALATMGSKTLVGSLAYGALQFSKMYRDVRPVAVINSIETRSQAEAWKRLFPNFHFIYVKSNLETRLYNHNSRKTDADSKTRFLELCEMYGDAEIASMEELAGINNLAVNIGIRGKHISESDGLYNLQKDIYAILDDIL